MKKRYVVPSECVCHVVESCLCQTSRRFNPNLGKNVLKDGVTSHDGFNENQFANGERDWANGW